MIYKYFHLNIILRSIGILIVSLGLAFTILTSNYVFTISLMVFVLVFQVWEFIIYMNRINRKLNVFFEQYGLKVSDIKSNSDKDTNQGFDQILLAINEIVKEKSIKAESQYHYLQSIVDNSQSGIISFNESNHKIEFINKTALNYLGLKTLNSLNTLQKSHTHIRKTIIDIKAGEQKIESLNSALGILQLSIKSSLIKFQDRSVKIISLQNIQAELEENELESWRKLVRVFTHEISNSIAPISSITNSLIKLIDSSDKEFDHDKRNDSIEGLKSIQNRNVALNSFIEKFRNLTRIPQLKPDSFRIRNLFETIYILFEEELQKNDIHLQIECKEDEMLYGDQHLIEQVLINLIKNAIQASNKTSSEIKLSGLKDKNGKIQISVSDFGKGINKEELNQIFVPFYTTKDGGSGIGLSLSRQIMHLHKGRISVESNLGEGSTFTLHF